MKNSEQYLTENGTGLTEQMFSNVREEVLVFEKLLYALESASDIHSTLEKNLETGLKDTSVEKLLRDYIAHIRYAHQLGKVYSNPDRWLRSRHNKQLRAQINRLRSQFRDDRELQNRARQEAAAEFAVINFF